MNPTQLRSDDVSTFPPHWSCWDSSKSVLDWGWGFLAGPIHSAEALLAVYRVGFELVAVAVGFLRDDQSNRWETPSRSLHGCIVYISKLATPKRYRNGWFQSETNTGFALIHTLYIRKHNKIKAYICSSMQCGNERMPKKDPPWLGWFTLTEFLAKGSGAPRLTRESVATTAKLWGEGVIRCHAAWSHGFGKSGFSWIFYNFLVFSVIIVRLEDLYIYI